MQINMASCQLGPTAPASTPAAVGRTPWSAADAPVGILLHGRTAGPGGPARRHLAPWTNGGSWGTRADQGVRPTTLANTMRSCVRYMNNAVETHDLVKRFGDFIAVDH